MEEEGGIATPGERRGRLVAAKAAEQTQVESVERLPVREECCIGEPYLLAEEQFRVVKGYESAFGIGFSPSRCARMMQISVWWREPYKGENQNEKRWNRQSAGCVDSAWIVRVGCFRAGTRRHI